MIQFVLIACQVGRYQNILKLSCRLLAFTSYKIFLINKKWSGISFPDSFAAWFLKKNISLVIFYYPTKSDCLVTFTTWDTGQCVFQLLVNQAVFLHDQKVKTKIEISLPRKELSRRNKKHFSSFVKGFHWSK